MTRDERRRLHEAAQEMIAASEKIKSMLCSSNDTYRALSQATGLSIKTLADIKKMKLFDVTIRNARSIAEAYEHWAELAIGASPSKSARSRPEAESRRFCWRPCSNPERPAMFSQRHRVVCDICEQTWLCHDIMEIYVQTFGTVGVACSKCVHSVGIMFVGSSLALKEAQQPRELFSDANDEAPDVPGASVHAADID